VRYVSNLMTDMLANVYDEDGGAPPQLPDETSSG
jgi:hypothetical protein